ncbi:hypothetical protein [Streptomyces humi]
MNSQDIPREIVRVPKSDESYVHAFVTVPVWHNPSTAEECACRGHRTALPGARDGQRPDRTVWLLCALAVLAGVGFVVSYATIPADTSVFVFPIGTVQALHFTLGTTLSVVLSCLGVAARRWAHGQMSRSSTSATPARRTSHRASWASPSAGSAASGCRP